MMGMLLRSRCSKARKNNSEANDANDGATSLASHCGQGVRTARRATCSVSSDLGEGVCPHHRPRDDARVRTNVGVTLATFYVPTLVPTLANSNAHLSHDTPLYKHAAARVSSMSYQRWYFYAAPRACLQRCIVHVVAVYMHPPTHRPRWLLHGLRHDRPAGRAARMYSRSASEYHGLEWPCAFPGLLVHQKLV